MTEYQKLIGAERITHMIEIVERQTRKMGVASAFEGGAAVFYGVDDGGDDTVVSPRIFN